MEKFEDAQHADFVVSYLLLDLDGTEEKKG